MNWQLYELKKKNIEAETPQEYDEAIKKILDEVEDKN